MNTYSNRGENIKKLPIDEICKKYLNGMSSIELGKEYGCTGGTIIQRLRDNDINIRSNSEAHKILDLPIQQISEKYLNGVSSIKLAEEYGCSSNTIIQKLRDNNINIRLYSEMNIIDLPIDEICKKYSNGMNSIKLGKEYGCDSSTIIRKLRDNNINIRSNSETHKLADLSINQIIEEYKSGISSNDIAKKYKCSCTIILNILRKFGVKIRSNSENQTLDLPMNQIIEEYKSGISTYNLGKKYNCSNETISRKLKENDINVTNIINLPIEQIINDYLNDMSTYDIGRKYNCSNTTISKKLKENNIDIRTIKESLNIISTHICISCGHEYEGKTRSLLCPECNDPNKYCDKYNEKCKEHNREKYDRECFFCGKSEEENGRKLDTHHIDNNKNQGCDEIPWKLVPLCMSCHGTVGGNEEKCKMWEARILYLYKEYWK